MKIPRFEKRLITVLSRLGTKIKEEELSEAVPGILFSKKKSGVIRGCAFPAPVGHGCIVSGAVSREAMAKAIAKIYKKGYVPRGMVMLFSCDDADDCNYPYGSVEDDRSHGFTFLRYATKGYESRKVVLVVIDGDNIPYWTDTRDSSYYKIARSQLIKTKGGVVWISHDNWISSILKHMGINVLQ